MRKILLSTAAVVALGLSVAGGMVVAAQAQSAPGMEGHDGGPMGRPGEGPHGPGGWMHHGHGGWMHHHDPMRMLGLFYPAEDRALTGSDVQKIAEAFLLFNGNRSWKVANVAENQDNTVSFAFAAPDGTVIARFAVDRKSGHFHRLG